jgi:hypothetical protein
LTDVEFASYVGNRVCLIDLEELGIIHIICQIQDCSCGRYPAAREGSKKMGTRTISPSKGRPDQ